jgi:hypothetical protein
MALVFFRQSIKGYCQPKPLSSNNAFIHPWFGGSLQLHQFFNAVFIFNPAEKFRMQHIVAAKPLQGIQSGALN